MSEQVVWLLPLRCTRCATSFPVPRLSFWGSSPLSTRRDTVPTAAQFWYLDILGSYLVGIILYCALFTTLLNPAWFHSQFYSMIEWFLCYSSKSIEITMIPWVASASIETLLKTLSHGANTTPLERSLRFSIISTEVCRWWFAHTRAVFAWWQKSAAFHWNSV